MNENAQVNALCKYRNVTKTRNIATVKFQNILL
jgi:hypothetical protein